MINLFSKLNNVFKVILLILAGFLIGIFSDKWLLNQNSSGDYKFVNPRSQVLYSKEKIPEEKEELKERLTAEINKMLDEQKAETISVYARIFEKGEWVGVNEDLRYAPASLLKVPLAIAFFKMEQAEPGILNKKLVFNGTYDRNDKESIQGSVEPLTAGHSYTIRELIRRMIVYSDNNAQKFLEANIDLAFFKEVYTDLGLPFPYDAVNKDFISPKAFAIIFRILYNSSYLNKKLSETILELLSQSEYGEGLVAGVPEGTALAHKFGERTAVTEQNKLIIRELHDCGVVYKKNNPYSICVMTRGYNFSLLQGVISKLSQIVYEDAE